GAIATAACPEPRRGSAGRSTSPSRGCGSSCDRSARRHERNAMTDLVRVDGRAPGDLRPLQAELGYLEWAEGWVLHEMGKTRVLVAASFEPKAPRFLSGTGSGWV